MAPGPRDPVVLDHRVAVAPQVYRWLRAAIIRGEIAPGLRLSESEIAAQMETSRQPVREAFIKLAEDRLIEVRPQRGTYVRKISIEAVMDARFVREAIEADIVRELARDPDPALISALRRQVQDQRRIARLDPDRFFELDDAFHRTLAEGSGHVHAWHLIEGLRSSLDRVRHLATRQFPVGSMIDQHEAVVEAISQGEVERADQAIRDHLRNILTELPRIARDRPGYFDRTPDLHQT
jgi:DNA-binding GntR family transcriptional regulator